MGIKQWVLRPEGDSGVIQQLQKETGLPPLVCRLLAVRGYASEDEASAFLQNAPLENPFNLADMDKGVACITAALEEGRRIAVYGDYDCDGITATVLLVSYLQNEGADVIYYLPGREREGYGLNKAALDFLKSQGTQLVITVDNGISAIDEIDYAASLGMEVLVTDHHQPREVLPDAVAVINPHRCDCPSRYKDLSGVGVAFKLVCALEGDDGGELMDYYADLVALGTIADVVPLTGDNRTLVRHGLAALADPHRPGIAALMEASGLAGKDIASESAAFGLIPRLNAAGRMGVADNAVELLLTESRHEADKISAELNELNILRKKTEDDILLLIAGLLEKEPWRLYARVLVVSGTGWHHGVVGIVASRLMERYGKPVIVFSIENGEARGSCRSLPGFSIIEAITACSQDVTKYGGHTLAAGLTLPAGKLDEFVARMESYALSRYPAMPPPCLLIDCTLPPSMLDIPSVEGLGVLEPFGAGNESPVFVLENAVLEGIHPTSGGRHVRLKLNLGNLHVYAVYFGMKAEGFPFSAGDKVDVAAHINTSEWNNSTRLNIKIKDIQPHGLDQQALIKSESTYESFLRSEITGKDQRMALVPGRGELAAVYRAIRKNSPLACGILGLYYRLFGQMDYCRMRLALDILEQAGLVVVQTRDGVLLLDAVETSVKADLDQTPILQKLKA